MNKQKFHIKLNDNSFYTLGEYKDNVLTYYESSKLRSKMSINIKDKTIEKDNIDYQIKLSFNKKKSTNTIYLKKESGKIDIETELKRFEISTKKIIINYIIVDSKEEVLLEIKVI